MVLCLRFPRLEVLTLGRLDLRVQVLGLGSQGLGS